MTMVYDTKGAPDWMRFTILADEAEFLAMKVSVESTIEDLEGMEKRDATDDQMLQLFRSIHRRMMRPAKKEAKVVNGHIG